MTPVKKYKFNKQDENLQMLTKYEIVKNRGANEEPATCTAD